MTVGILPVLSQNPDDIQPGTVRQMDWPTAGGSGDEVQVGLFIRAVQADDEVIGMRGVHDVGFLLMASRNRLDPATAI